MVSVVTEDGAEACPKCDCARLTQELEESRLQIVQLTQIAKDQAKALAELTDECPPWAPSLAIIYWLYGPTRWAERGWHSFWNRLVPVVNAIGDMPAAKLTPVPTSPAGPMPTLAPPG